MRDMTSRRLRSMLLLQGAAVCLLFSLCAGVVHAQATVPQVAGSAPARPPLSTALGDAPADPGPRTTLPADIRPANVKRIMRLVADREWRRTTAAPSQDWTMVPLYLGLLSASRTLGDARYHDEVLAHAQGFGWKLGPRQMHADDQAIGQVYLELYADNHDPQRIAGMRAQFDDLLQMPDPRDPARPVWWWCDALFMAPPAWDALSRVTADARYAVYVDHQWKITDHLLWNDDNKLFARDATFLDKHEANGQPIFWSRGNGWVMAGLARQLEELPATDARRPFYMQRFRQMSARVAALQGRDGLWRPGLLDAEHYPLPETSGSAFFIYAMAWGVNHGILPAKTYKPILRKAWAGMVSQIYADGRLGSVQPIGAAPGAYTASANYVFGSGAFLMAGEQMAHIH